MQYQANAIRKFRLVSAASLVAALAVTYAGASSAACSVTRDEVVKMVQSGMSEDVVAKQLDGCIAADLADSTQLGIVASKNDGVYITNTGSTFFEAITSCGYHPQRKEVTCPIVIRQQFGYGGLPALQPVGSYEYLQFCVDTGAGLMPVNSNGVHVHDSKTLPPWQMTAVVAADVDFAPRLFSRPLLGQTFRARAILSWGIPAFGNCNYNPIWGNQADFRIRLDP